MKTLDKKDFGEAAAYITAWKHPLLVSHTIPDGDALGSLAAMRLLLQSKGIEAAAALFDPIPHRYAMFRRFGPMPLWKSELAESDLGKVDGVIILDTCSYKQLDPMADWLRATTLPKLAVDHHLTRDDLADLYLIDESAAANCLILYDWARAVDWPIAPQTSAALFTGIAMDTGWFRFANTDGRAFSACADLMERGANGPELYQQLYLGESPGRVKLLQAALATMELLAAERLAVMVLAAEAFPRVGATYVDTEDIVNEPMRIGSVVVSVLLVDRGDGIIRVSFRSKPAFTADMPDVDVAAAAQTFGGGGHRRAAGARVKGSLAEVRRIIIEHFQGLLPR